MRPSYHLLPCHPAPQGVGYGRMHIILHPGEGDAPWQQLSHEWYGRPVVPAFEFRFRLGADALLFSARRASPALLHPQAKENHFQPDLWRYDTAEFFLATEDARSYLEFNLAPNGAWWAAAFSAPRVPAPNVPAIPAGVSTSGHAGPNGWACEARIPLASLRPLGLFPATTPYRLAAAAILNSPAQIFLTTAPTTQGKPNFHRPQDFYFVASPPPHGGSPLRGAC